MLQNVEFAGNRAMHKRKLRKIRKTTSNTSNSVMTEKWREAEKKGTNLSEDYCSDVS